MELTLQGGGPGAADAADLALPLVAVRGARPGPSLFVTAAVHGDEVNGVAVVHELLAGIDPEVLAGTLLAVPVCNLPAYLARRRELAEDGDLNRSFPGRAAGPAGGRLARRLLHTVILPCDRGIDLHTAAEERVNFPHLRADLDDPPTAELARAFGWPLLVHDPGPPRSLRRAATAAGVPTIAYEAGSARRFERGAIALGTRGIRAAMGRFGMLPGDEPTAAGSFPPGPLPGAPFLILESRWLRARRSGLLDLAVLPGQPVDRGEPVATCWDPLAGTQEELEAPCDGLVLGLARQPVVDAGEPVCQVARLEGGDLTRWRGIWQSHGGRFIV
ncbi:MAG TPA: succinylglutamate desuccinylase/aspartoacylase family protein [Thermoanaerobaculia bacterium]|nr:succinylglutamate desuccinylase/aspartoacylase family protein [Thermoanaerobaculia bacterium]